MSSRERDKTAVDDRFYTASTEYFHHLSLLPQPFAFPKSRAEKLIIVIADIDMGTETKKKGLPFPTPQTLAVFPRTQMLP